MPKLNQLSPVPPQTAKLILAGLDDGLKLKVAGLFNNYVVASDEETAHDRLAEDIKYTVEAYEEIKAELEVILAPQVVAQAPAKPGRTFEPGMP
jgi:hypothetical protein